MRSESSRPRFLASTITALAVEADRQSSAGGIRECLRVGCYREEIVFST